MTSRSVSIWQCVQGHSAELNICRNNTDINNDTYTGTRYVILAKHWVWLPDDGFI